MFLVNVIMTIRTEKVKWHKNKLYSSLSEKYQVFEHENFTFEPWQFNRNPHIKFNIDLTEPSKTFPRNAKWFSKEILAFKQCFIDLIKMRWVLQCTVAMLCVQKNCQSKNLIHFFPSIFGHTQVSSDLLELSTGEKSSQT